MSAKTDSANLVLRSAHALLAVACALGVAHMLWPEHEWGQGRDSYVNFANGLSFPSWLTAMLLVALALASIASFHRERDTQRDVEMPFRWAWWIVACGALGLSFVEMTRIHHRFELLGFPSPGLYGRLTFACGAIIVLGLLGLFLHGRTKHDPQTAVYTHAGLSLAALATIARVTALPKLVPPAVSELTRMLQGLSWLASCILLLTAVVLHALAPAIAKTRSVEATRPPTLKTYIGIGATTFCLIVLQVLLFQLLNIFGGHLRANSVISIALLGIAVGGLIGFFSSKTNPRTAAATASVIFPVAILMSFGGVVSLEGFPILQSLVLAVPFAASATVVTLKLVEADTHVVYFIDLAGAGLGALMVGPAFVLLREEGAIVMLAAVAAVVSLCFTTDVESERTRSPLRVGTLVGAWMVAVVAIANPFVDWLNVVAEQVHAEYPNAKFIASRGSFVGRYDVVRRTPQSTVLKTMENGHTIDTVRTSPVDEYQIDPRLPHNLIADPVILILGVSGDGITKTSRFMSREVYGVEINPEIVDLMKGQLVPYNGDSYQGIDVEPIDGRNYLRLYDRQYDYITLLNAHFARGYTDDAAASPEYLHTYDAFATYLDRLTDRGMVILEEVHQVPRREASSWKMLRTMRQVLVDRGVANPEKHFFLFQWKTNTNNYLQILFAKSPFDEARLARLEQWLQAVDDIKELGERAGKRLGPILTSTTTVLYAPDRGFANAYAHVLESDSADAMLRAYQITPTTDDRPFPFDVNPKRPRLTSASARTSILLLGLLPFFGVFLRRHRSELVTALPYTLTVALTGLGYFLVEVVLIQRYQIFLGSPVVAFSAVLATLLIGSGLGSFWSRKLDERRLYLALAVLVLLLPLHLWLVPPILATAQRLGLLARVLVGCATIAPLAFVLGIPFPTIMRMGKDRLTPSGAAMLFAINAAASALAVPLTLSLTTEYGFARTMMFGAALYLVVAGLVLSLRRPSARMPANAVALFALLLLFASPWLITIRAASAADASAGAPYRVFAASYARSKHDKSSLVQGASGRVRMEWMFWIVRGEGRTILVDTGCPKPDDKWRKRFTRFTLPTERLAGLGIEPSDVSDVILTHAHWDHAGGLAPFTRAKVWMQKTEYDFAESRLSKDRRRSKGMRFEDLEQLRRARDEGRLQLVDGEQEILPGVTVRPGGGHTPGSQLVAIRALEGTIVLASDAAYLYENIFRHRAVGATSDPAEDLELIRWMHKHAASHYYAVPGHDPRVMSWFPDVADGVVEISGVGR